MYKGVDHVVIAVKDMEAAIAKYEAIYGPVSDRGEPPGAGFTTAFFRFAESYIELVCPTGDQGPVAKRLADSGEGVYMIAMKVGDIDETLTQLRAKGVRLIGDPGAGNPVAGQVFIHPAGTGGVLTQLIQR
jgi:methylmalonyl-CoA/ethylmalonyl-CoA epimerase